MTNAPESQDQPRTTDSDSTPVPTVAELLRTARAGNAFFGELLGRLDDDEFDAPSLLPGWTRSHVIAHMGYNAFGLSRLMTWASTGVETPMYPSMEARTAEVEEGAKRSPAELRELWASGIATLESAWAAADDDAWHATVRTAQGKEIEASVTLWMRAREIWVHAVDLDLGATFDDLPPRVLRGVLDEVIGNWHARGADAGLLLRIEGEHGFEIGDRAAESPTVISGSLAAVTAWATGRGTDVTSSAGAVEPAPRWM